MAKLQDTLEQLVAGENTCEVPQKIHQKLENGEFTKKWKDFRGFRADFVIIAKLMYSYIYIPWFMDVYGYIELVNGC